MNRMMRWVSKAVVVAGGLGLAAGSALAADHADPPAVAASGDSDITDLFAWMTKDGTKLNVAMTLNLSGSTAKFSDAVQYVFHINSKAAYGAATEKSHTVICTFDAAQKASCWLDDVEYVSGDANQVAGIYSTSRKLRIWAGERNDPFFFNGHGFTATLATVKGALGGLTFDDAGCPALSGDVSAALVNQLKTDAAGNNNGVPMATTDTYKGKNVYAIVVQIDKTLLTDGGSTLAVWASTRK